MVLPLALEFPDAVVRLPAQLPDAVGEMLDHLPELGRDESALALINRHAVDYRAEDIQLALAGRPVADADRTGAVEAGEMLEVLLRQVRIAVDPVEDLHCEVMVVGAVPDPVDKVGGFLGEPGAEERGNAVGGVAQPAEAVVPVAIAARILGNRGGGGGAERSGGSIGQQLDDERGAANGVPERARIEALVEPSLPELAGPRRQLGRVAADRELPAEGAIAIADTERDPFLPYRMQVEPEAEAGPALHGFTGA